MQAASSITQLLVTVRLGILGPLINTHLQKPPSQSARTPSPCTLAARGRKSSLEGGRRCWRETITHQSPRAPYAKLKLHLIQTKPCQSIWPVNWQGKCKLSNTRAYWLDFRITLTQRIGKALPIQKMTTDRYKERVLKAIWEESARSCRYRYTTRWLDLKLTRAR